jgi:hypothetical protein
LLTTQGNDGGDFTLPPGIHFLWEYHVRAENPDGCFTLGSALIVHVFDNANTATGQGGNGVNQTSGLEFFLCYATMKATLLKNLTDPVDPLYVQTRGAFSPLSEGNVFMGYGQVPKMKEYRPTGDVRMDVQFGYLNANIATISYRAFKIVWDATPAADPVAVGWNGVGYMSWNGATNISHWEIYEGTTADNLARSRSVIKLGFETNATLNSGTKFFKAAAVRESESVYRFSNVAPVLIGPELLPPLEYGVEPGIINTIDPSS